MADLNMEAERAAFEAWFAKNSPSTNTKRRANGAYEAENLNALWDRWLIDAGFPPRRAAPVVADDGLPPLPEPDADLLGDGTDMVWGAAKVRQAQRDAIAADRAARAQQQTQSIDTPEFRVLVDAIDMEGRTNHERGVAALMAHINAWGRAGRTVEAPGWIDLKDAKPKDWQRVLVALDTGTVAEGYRGSVGWHWGETDYPEDVEATATHWMPWPEHPRNAAPSPQQGKEGVNEN